LDWQWDRFVGKGVTREFRRELDGIRDGCVKVGKGESFTFVKRVLVISSYPGQI
jgi:hypothetical protein